MCGFEALSIVAENAGGATEAVPLEATDRSAGGTIVVDTQSTASAPRIDSHYSTGDKAQTQEDSRKTRNVTPASESMTGSGTVTQDVQGASQGTLGATVASFHGSWAATNLESEESDYSDEVLIEEEDRPEYSHGDNQGQKFEERTFPRVSRENFILEDIGDDANPDCNIETVQPSFFEDARSEDGRSQACGSKTYQRMKELQLDMDSSTDDEEEEEEEEESSKSSSRIPRSIPFKQSKVSKLAEHFEQLSREFQKERMQERREGRSRQLRAYPLASSKPVVEVYRDVYDAVQEHNASDEDILSGSTPRESIDNSTLGDSAHTENTDTMSGATSPTEELRRYREKKKRWSAGIFNRSHSQSVASDSSSADDDPLEDIEPTSRRMRRRLRGPQDRQKSLIFAERSTESVPLQTGFFTKLDTSDEENLESNVSANADLPFAGLRFKELPFNDSDSDQDEWHRNTPQADLDGCQNVLKPTRVTSHGLSDHAPAQCMDKKDTVNVLGKERHIAFACGSEKEQEMPGKDSTPLPTSATRAGKPAKRVATFNFSSLASIPEHKSEDSNINTRKMPVADRMKRKHPNTAHGVHKLASSDEKSNGEPEDTIVFDSHTTGEGDYFGDWSSPSVSSSVNKAGSATSPLKDDVQLQQPSYDSNMPGFEPHTGPETPTILVCDVDGCGAVYLGADRRADLVRHNRQMHQNSYPQYHCEDTVCDRVFLSLDARLEHYGKDHPNLAQMMSSQLRHLSMSMDATTPPLGNLDNQQWPARDRENQAIPVIQNVHNQHANAEGETNVDPHDSTSFVIFEGGKTQQYAGDSTLSGNYWFSVIGPLYRQDAILGGTGETRNKVETPVTDSSHTSLVQATKIVLPEDSDGGVNENADPGWRMQLTKELLDNNQPILNRAFRPLTWTPSATDINDRINTDHEISLLKVTFEGSVDQSEAGDDSSASASCAPSVISVFSVESLASSASDLSKASGYSAVQIATATKVLISIFHEDEVLLPLYRYALDNPVIGPERLQRNLRRLIKAYADHLDDEAKDRLEYLASRLVSIKSRWLAQSIVDKLSNNPLMQRSVDVVEQQDDSSDDELDERPAVSETIFEDLVVFREFLTGSNAFEKLRTQVRVFVFPKSADITATATTQPNLLHSTMKPTSPESGVPKIGTWEEWLGDVINFMDGFLRHPIDFREVLLLLLLHLLVDAVYLASDGILMQTGFLEPPLHPKKTRLRWNCRCGELLMGDITEMRQGGVAELTARMEQHSGVKVSVTRYSQGTNNQQYIVPQPRRWLRNGVAKFTAALTGASKPTPCLPQHNTSCASSTRTSSQTTISQPSILHLLACMHQNRFRKVLQQDRIETIDTDRALLCFMRQQYKHHRGRVMHFLSLKSVKGIFFVKFRLPLGGSVDVRHHDPCCVSGLTQSGCECIPPKEKVEPSPQAEYRCIPGPPATYPPVPPEYLKSIFMCPTDVHEKDTWILNQLPKRTCGELQGQIGQPADGWGIYYQDDWDRDAICLFMFIILCFATAVFAILYSRFQHDVQAAFGVSAYIVALVTVLLSLIGSRLERLG